MLDDQQHEPADTPQVIQEPRCDKCGARVPDIVCYAGAALDEGARLPRKQYYRCTKCGHTWKVIRV